MTSQIAPVSKRTGIHDFRHTHTTLMLEANANIKVIQKRLDHSTINFN